MRLLIVLLLPLLILNIGFAQVKLLKNEELLYSFKTKKGKQMILAKDKQNKYIIYRFGTSKKTELEFPAIKDSTSWNKFSYFHYLRPGGIQNAGLDLQSIYFQNGNYYYNIYEDYSSEGESYETGVLIEDITTKIEKDCKGIYKSKRGNLLDLIDSGKLKESEKSR